MFDGDTGAGDPAKSETDAAKTDAQAQDAAHDDLDTIDGLGDKGKDAIRKERATAKAAADALKSANKQLADLQKEKDERTAAEAKAKEAEAAERGEFETLAQKREEERDAAKAEATTLKGENEALTAAMASGIEAGWKALPEEVRKLGEKQHPEDDVLGRFQFLNDPDTTALVAKLTDKETKRGNGVGPRSSGDGKSTNDEAARKAQSGMYRSF